MRRRRALPAVVATLAAALAAAPAAVALAQDNPPPPFEEVQYTPPPEGEGALPGSPAAPPATTAPSAPAATLATPPPPKPGPSGWTPGEGFILRSDTGDYKLRIGLQAGYKFEPVVQEGEYSNRRAFFVLRPIFAGNFYKEWIRFWTSLELASNPPYVLDSYVEVQPRQEIGVRLGQQYTLISRHEEFGPQQILFPEWAPVAEYFWTGRDKGVTAWGTLAGGLFKYYAGTYSGTPLRQFQVISGNYVFEGRLDWYPLGATGATEYPYILAGGSPFRVSASLQGYYAKVQLAQENFNPSSFRFDVMATGDLRVQACGLADFWIQGPRYIGFVEGYFRHTDPDVTHVTYDSIGVWGQVGYMLIPRRLDGGLRFNWLNPSTDLGNDQFISGEVQLAYYVTESPNLVLKARYGIAEQHSPGMDALGAVPLVLAAGTTQLFTAQLNLAF